MGIHRLNPSVGSKKFVDLPAEFIVDFPAQGDVSKFGDGYDYRDDGGEDVNGDTRYPLWRNLVSLADFPNLNDGIDKE